MSEIKQKRLKILTELFGEQIKQIIETEKLNISEKELLTKFSDYEITESGKYLEWMIKTYINNGFLYEDLYKVKETLEIFHDNKMKLPKDKRDIQQYRTLADLWIEVKKFVEQKDDFLSMNEQKRKEKEQAYSETEFLYEDDNLRIIVPLTENSSKWWGKGTRWCTAADKNNMFMEYFEDAPLLIFSFKDGTKWQLWMNRRNTQFMDEDDKKISGKKIKENWELIENIFMKLLEINGYLLSFYPVEFRTKKICELAVNNNGNVLFYVPKKIMTKELCEIAVKNSGNSLYYVPKNFKTQELCEMAVRKNGNSLIYAPKELKTKEICEIAVQQNGDALGYAPFDLRTQELCELAVKQNGEVLQSVPFNLKTEELCKLAVRNNGNALQYVPTILRTKELCEIAVKQNGTSLLYVPNNLKTKNICEIAVNNNGWAIEDVPKRFKTKKLCQSVIEKNGMLLNFVPYELVTEELCKTAVKNNKKALKYVPEKFITKELCDIEQKEDDIIINNNLDKYKEIFFILMQENKILLDKNNNFH